ncbi:glycine rich protein family domain-containing protein [Ditylenchus destructor]|uniref:Glycine rich protein family domain-containing protein n=1 Tax=Ditylenchus destructor TaxID=166010 RepID=A0AAD4NCE9_9BILA|nr:glycine rich protein family domain-containing protein [Ditylenchus destructor]
MASGNPENPGFGQATDHASPLGSGRVMHESLRLGELSRLVPVSPGTSAISGIYGFRKSGKSWMTKGAAMRRSRWVVLWNALSKMLKLILEFSIAKRKHVTFLGESTKLDHETTFSVKKSILHFVFLAEMAKILLISIGLMLLVNPVLGQMQEATKHSGTAVEMNMPTLRAKRHGYGYGGEGGWGNGGGYYPYGGGYGGGFPYEGGYGGGNTVIIKKIIRYEPGWGKK